MTDGEQVVSRRAPARLRLWPAHIGWLFLIWIAGLIVLASVAVFVGILMNAAGLTS